VIEVLTEIQHEIYKLLNQNLWEKFKKSPLFDEWIEKRIKKEKRNTNMSKADKLK